MRRMNTFWTDVEAVGVVVGIFAGLCIVATTIIAFTQSQLSRWVRTQLTRLWNWASDPHGYQRQIDELKAERRVFDAEARANIAAIQKNADMVGYAALEGSRQFALLQERMLAIQEAHDEALTAQKEQLAVLRRDKEAAQRALEELGIKVNRNAVVDAIAQNQPKPQRESMAQKLQDRDL
jgi:hypothetical protein